MCPGQARYRTQGHLKPVALALGHPEPVIAVRVRHNVAYTHVLHGRRREATDPRPRPVPSYDGPVTGPSTRRPTLPPTPPVIPGERRLAHPPSDRYRVAEPPNPAGDPTASPTRGVALGIVAAVVGAVATTILGGVLAVSAGLLVVAVATGWAVAVGLRTGGGQRLSTDRRVRLALGLATLSVAMGQAGLWLYALTEGGVLWPLDYLAQTFGPIVPLEFVAASVVAWAAAR